MTTFVKLETAAKTAGMSLRHFKRLIEAGNIKTIVINKTGFVLGTELSTLIEQRRLHPPLRTGRPKA